LAAIQLRQARYENVNERCNSGDGIRQLSRDANTPTQPSAGRACEGRLKRQESVGAIWRRRSKLSYTGQMGLKFRFLKKSRLLKSFKIKYL
jgi:hypothetical protein